MLSEKKMIDFKNKIVELKPKLDVIFRELYFEYSEPNEILVLDELILFIELNYDVSEPNVGMYNLYWFLKMNQHKPIIFNFDKNLNLKLYNIIGN